MYSFEGSIALKFGYRLEVVVGVCVIMKRTASLPSTAVSITVVKDAYGN